MASRKRHSISICDVTQMHVNNTLYEKRCGPSSDPKWPCFTHWGGDLNGVAINPWLRPLDMTEEILLKDDKAEGKSLLLY